MTEADRVLALCAAAPDDDGPRLVWADLVGGERGELVVIQCDLARGGLSLPEVVRRRRRERELLRKHGTAWAGSLATIARQWRFRRGFVEAIAIDPEGLPEGLVLEQHPFIASVSIRGWRTRLEQVRRQIPRLVRPPRAVMLEVDLEGAGDTLAAIGWTAALRGFGVSSLRPETIHEVIGLVTPALQQLWLREHLLPDESVAMVLGHAPNIEALELVSVEGEWRRINDLPPEIDIRSILTMPLRTLVISGLTHTDLLSITSIATLESLSCTVPRADVDIRLAMHDFQALRSFEIAGDAVEAVLHAMIDKSSISNLHTLRQLRVRGEVTVETIAAVVANYGPQLETFEVAVPALDARTLTSIVDRYAMQGELVVAPQVAMWPAPQPRLPVLVQAELLETHTTCYAAMERAWLVRVDRDRQIWELPPLPSDAEFLLGRSRDAQVHLPSSMVARRHARIRWRDGRHEIEDMASTNGTIVDGMRVERHVLADGMHLVCGDCEMRYFVGDGGDERARAVLATYD